ncbi:MAG: thiamine-phosphate pyrophosphorylase [Candidatus Omnitrophota bacterium]
MRTPGLACDSYRLIDANFNRAKEGLRVCEDIVRFHLNHARLTQKFKNIRHRLSAILKSANIDPLGLIQERNIRRDVAKISCLSKKKASFCQIFLANMQRTKEALRVLEEFLKLFDKTATRKIQHLRFQCYALEQETIKKFPALLDPR